MDNWKFSSPQAWSPCTTIPQDCSPIALTNCLYKLLGRLNNIYLMWYLEYSFTKSVWFLSWPKHSWFSSLFWDSNHSSICMLWFSISCPFFYLEKAYQVVATYLSTTIIPKHGYFHKVLSFWVHLLCQIYLFYFFFFSPQFEGVLQGNVISTKLFLDGLVSALPQGIWSLMNMDDLAILVSGPSRDMYRILTSTFSIWCSHPVLTFWQVPWCHYWLQTVLVRSYPLC